MSVGNLTPPSSRTIVFQPPIDEARLWDLKTSKGLVDVKDVMKKPDDYYAPKGKFLWDPWFRKEGELYHVYYLQCPRETPYLERHFAGVEVGHAVSRDLITFEEQKRALKPGKPGSWDGMAVWDGTIEKTGGKYHMYYTGISSHDREQKIGHATSSDMNTWEKTSEHPVLEADGVIYNKRLTLNELGNPSAFRDPYLFQDKRDGRYYMTISARENTNQPYNACVGLASTKDLTNWKLEAPLFAPKTFDEMEETKIIQHDNRYYLFFSTYDRNIKPEFKEQTKAQGGLHCYVANDLRGPFSPVNKNGLVFSDQEMVYGGKVIQEPDGKFTGMGWIDQLPDGQPVARMARPFNIKIQGDKITVEKGVTQKQ